MKNPWLYFPRPVEHPRMRLFCLPYAGGRAGAYREWPDALPDDVEICAVQLPGRGARLAEPSLRSLDHVVDELAAAIAPLLSRPFMLFGHSMGALMAYALARVLCVPGGSGPSHLMVSGCPAPRLVGAAHRPLHALPDEDLMVELGRLNGTPHEVLQNPAMMRMALPVIRADLEVFETWRCPQTQPLPIPIAAFAGRDDPRAPLGAVAGWHDETRAGYTVHELPGDHFFLHSAHDMLLRLVAGIVGPSSVAAAA
jgi:medium-chain acyl-[acyl-carrier-protein] hydrolase